MFVHNDKFHFKLTIIISIKIICIMQLLLIAELFNMLVGHINAVLMLIYKKNELIDLPFSQS